MRVPVNVPIVGPNAGRYLDDCIASGWISSEGPYVARFEQAWADYCGARYGVAVSSGSAALEIAVRSLNLPAGSEVILPSFTIITCALAVLASGCTPVLVDCDPDTWCMDVQAVEQAITDKTKAVMPVHIYGHPVDMTPMMAIAKKHGLYVIEDAAEAHGAEVDGRRVGAIGNLGCFSFYANKIITTGEGGMVVTNDPDLAERLRYHRNICFKPDRRFLHDDLGRNFRITNLQAALGVAQVEEADRYVATKIRNAARYTDDLTGVDGLRLPVQRPWAKNVYWMYGIVLDENTGMTATALAEELNRHGIATRPFFVGMHRQPALRRLGLFDGVAMPETDRIADNGLYLPSGLKLSEEEIDYTCARLREIMRNRPGRT